MACWETGHIIHKNVFRSFRLSAVVIMHSAQVGPFENFSRQFALKIPKFWTKVINPMLRYLTTLLKSVFIYLFFFYSNFCFFHLSSYTGKKKIKNISSEGNIYLQHVKYVIFYGN